MRDLTLHESIIRKTLYAPEWNTYHEQWQAYPHAGGYDSESIPLTEDEAAVVIEATSLVLCVTCSRVIEEGDRRLVHRYRTYCEEHGREYLAEHPDVGVRDA